MPTTIERISEGPRAGRYLVMAYTSKRPYRDPADPRQAIVPVTAIGAITCTRVGAWLVARQLERGTALAKERASS